MKTKEQPQAETKYQRAILCAVCSEPLKTARFTADGFLAVCPDENCGSLCENGSLVVCEVCDDPLMLIRVTTDGWIAQCSDINCSTLHLGEF